MTYGLPSHQVASRCQVSVIVCRPSQRVTAYSPPANSLIVTPAPPATSGPTVIHCS